METEVRPKRPKPQTELHKLKVRAGIKRSYLKRFEKNYREHHAKILADLRDLELRIEDEERRTGAGEVNEAATAWA